MAQYHRGSSNSSGEGRHRVIGRADPGGFRGDSGGIQGDDDAYPLSRIILVSARGWPLGSGNRGWLVEGVVR